MEEPEKENKMKTAPLPPRQKRIKSVEAEPLPKNLKTIDNLMSKYEDHIINLKRELKKAFHDLQKVNNINQSLSKENNTLVLRLQQKTQ